MPIHDEQFGTGSAPNFQSFLENFKAESLPSEFEVSDDIIDFWKRNPQFGFQVIGPATFESPEISALDRIKIWDDAYNSLRKKSIPPVRRPYSLPQPPEVLDFRDPRLTEQERALRFLAETGVWVAELPAKILLAAEEAIIAAANTAIGVAGIATGKELDFIDTVPLPFDARRLGYRDKVIEPAAQRFWERVIDLEKAKPSDNRFEMFGKGLIAFSEEIFPTAFELVIGGDLAILGAKSILKVTRFNPELTSAFGRLEKLGVDVAGEQFAITEYRAALEKFLKEAAVEGSYDDILIALRDLDTIGKAVRSGEIIVDPLNPNIALRSVDLNALGQGLQNLAAGLLTPVDELLARLSAQKIKPKDFAETFSELPGARPVDPQPAFGLSIQGFEEVGRPLSRDTLRILENRLKGVVDEFRRAGTLGRLLPRGIGAADINRASILDNLGEGLNELILFGDIKNKNIQRLTGPGLEIPPTEVGSLRIRIVPDTPEGAAFFKGLAGDAGQVIDITDIENLVREIARLSDNDLPFGTFGPDTDEVRNFLDAMRAFAQDFKSRGFNISENIAVEDIPIKALEGESIVDNELLKQVREFGDQRGIVVIRDGDQFRLLKGREQIQLAKERGLKSVEAVVLNAETATPLNRLEDDIARIPEKPIELPPEAKELTDALDDELAKKITRGKPGISKGPVDPRKIETIRDFDKLSYEDQERVFSSLSKDLQNKIMGGFDDSAMDKQAKKDFLQAIRDKGYLKIEGSVWETELREAKAHKLNITRKGKGLELNVMLGELQADFPEIKSTDDIIEIFQTGRFPARDFDIYFPSKNLTQSKEFQALTPEMKDKIKTFFRPSRNRVPRAFQLLGNKDTTVPVFRKIIEKWVQDGYDIFIEPYGGAFTIGTYALDDAIKAGLKEFHTNIFDKEKFIILKAIQNGQVEEVKSLIQQTAQSYSDLIRESAIGEPKKVIEEFFEDHPDSFIGSREWFSFVRARPIGSRVTVYEDDFVAWGGLFKAAKASMLPEEIVGLESAVVSAFFSRIANRSGELIRKTGFAQFESILFEKWGMNAGFDEMAKFFRLAEDNGVKVNIQSMDGVDFLKSLDLDPGRTAYYLDPPYIRSADTYKNAPPAELEKFLDAEKFIEAHGDVFRNISEGSRAAFTNDVHQEYLEKMLGQIPDGKIFAYREGQTPTSLFVQSDIADVTEEALTLKKEAQAGQREEVVRIFELRDELGLNGLTMGRLRRAYGITKIKDATDDQLDALYAFMQTLEPHDSLVTPKQLEGMKDLFLQSDMHKPPQLWTQREMIERFRETSEILAGPITRWISNTAFPTVDIKEESALIKGIIDDIEAELFGVRENIETFIKDFEKLSSAAKKSRGDLLTPAERAKRRVLRTQEEVFKAMSGKKVKLTPEEQALVDFMRDFFEVVRQDLAIQKRKNYITHLEADLLEKIANKGIMGALKDLPKMFQRKEGIPVDIMIELDNIIGTEKFFRFALQRRGGITPTMDIDRIVVTYADLYYTKLALDRILPLGQVMVKHLLQPQTAIWMKKYLQNLKGRGLDYGFRNGKFGWAATVADGVVDLGYFKLLGFNVWSGMVNYVAAETNNFIVQDFNKYLRGKKRYFENPKKAWEVFRQMGLMEGAFYEYVSRGTLFSNPVARDTVFIFQRAGEHIARGTMVLGEMTPKEWAAGKLSPKRQVEIQDLIAIAQGVFTKAQSPLMVQTSAGRVVLQMNRWRITNAALVRRITKQAKKDIKAGNMKGQGIRRLVKMLFMFGMGTYLSYEFAKMGHKRMKRVAGAMAEVLGSIYETVTDAVFLEFVTENPSVSAIQGLYFDFQNLLNYIGVPGAEKPDPIQFRETFFGSFFAPVDVPREILENIQGSQERGVNMEAFFGEDEIGTGTREIGVDVDALDSRQRRQPSGDADFSQFLKGF